MRNLLLCLGLLLAISITGCTFGSSKPKTPPGEKVKSSATSAVPTETVKLAAGEFLVQDAAGKTILKATTGEDKLIILEGADGAFVGMMENNATGISFSDTKTENGKMTNATGKMKANETGFNLEDSSGTKLAKIEARDGGYRIKDAAGKTLGKLKPDGSDCKVGDEAGAKIAKAKLKGDKILVEDAKGDTLYQITGVKNTQAAAVWAIAGWTPLQKTAVMLALNK